MSEAEPKRWRVRSKRDKDKELAELLEASLNSDEMRPIMVLAIQAFTETLLSVAIKSGDKDRRSSIV